MLAAGLEAAIVDQRFLVAMAAWVVTLFLVTGAVIDGIALRVPNWLTFPMILSAWATGFVVFGWPGLWASLVGTLVGLGLLLPLYAIGGMGAGDVKLLAGVGAWIGAQHTLWAFVVSVVVGAILGVALAVCQRRLGECAVNFRVIASELIFIRNPQVLAELAAERKPRALLLPYGIPIALGCIGYLIYQGMLP